MVPRAPATGILEPSNKWERNKHKILELYLKDRHTLREVKTIMAEEHGFHASYRIYQERLKAWGISKTLKKDEKDRLLEAVERGDVAVNSDTERKLKRHKSMKRKLPDQAETTSIQNESFQAKNVGSKRPYRASEASVQASHAARLSQSTSNSDSRAVIGSWAPNSLPNTASQTKRLLISTPLSISNDRTKCDLDLVLRCTKTFINWWEDNPPHKGCLWPQAPPQLPATVSKFLNNLEWCRYLFKLNDVRRGIPLIRSITAVTSGVMYNPTPEFAKRLFDLFSPVNYRLNPYVRKVLVQHICKIADLDLGPNHPLTVACNQLRHDDQSRYITDEIFACLQCLVKEKWPSLEHETRASAIANLRRDRQFKQAMEMASGLLAQSEEHFGRESTQARDAAAELAHVYMDTGNLLDAQGLCLRRAGRAMTSDGIVGHQYGDSRTVSAWEDLAEIERKAGNMNHSRVWLHQAANLQKDLKGLSISTTHIIDKLDDSLRLCGLDYDAEICRKQYQPYVWTDNTDVTQY